MRERSNQARCQPPGAQVPVSTARPLRAFTYAGSLPANLDIWVLGAERVREQVEAAMVISQATLGMATLALLAAASSIAQAQSEQKPSAPAKTPRVMAADAAAEKSQVEAPSKQKKLTMCLETWDAQTHMTKREWRTACARSVRDYPDAFDR